MSRRDDRRPNISRPFDPAVSAWGQQPDRSSPAATHPTISAPSNVQTSVWPNGDDDAPSAPNDPSDRGHQRDFSDTSRDIPLMFQGTQGSIDGTMEGDNAQANMTSRFSSDSSRPTTGNASQAPVTSRFSSDTDDRPSTGGQGSSGDQGMRNTWIGSSPDSATCRERDTELQRRQLRQQQRRGHQVGASEVSDASREVVIGLETTTTAPDSRRTSSEYSQ
ncbi:hypothetical protein L202_02620 [Cryptococcus amylolentus CBS 6039]|uniref:Uncharacterized protein n=1 Tax=Cryptococcus amylolentus CBS 6039 TaxID=1295533 RepID=A0A1E3HVL9_9TREE|nr:hypothetical protein L202_02620 [Cryptococcus amylolentus CBS 6039]ODN80359.1 hypothetical protein L202_02620 [Cryptococcus amylolentus CBS 6039]